ncbi:glycosyl transferase family 39 [Candidatus Vecturithrix granuli]|uniref:Glycosyl transferase family 39 n=1 Tax=Vecturithrix granuli TaxID=1499967 RepID=A0A081BTS0_VECG1|nr:glycosyl transferase family 39 [Candidatus Vecturithrix granuli]
MFWLIVGLAFGVRVAAILLAGDVLERNLSLDAMSYHAIAHNLVEHQIFNSPFDPPYRPDQPGTFRPPLTPFFLAAIYAIAGVNLLWGQIGLAVISAFTCGLTYRLGAKLFEPTIGILAGVLICGYPLLLLFVLLPLTEGLSIFLTLALMNLFYDEQADRMRHILLIGVVFGLLLLNKAANIVVVSCLLVWGFGRLSGSYVIQGMKIGFIAITAAVIILPWTLRNLTVTGTCIPINSNGGWTFYLGNNPHTEKNLTALERGASNGWIPSQEVYLPFQDLKFGDTRGYEARSIQLGWQFIKQHPGTFLNFALRKLKIFWSPYQHVLDKITWYPLAIFSLIGLGYALVQWRHHLLIYILLLSSMSIPIMFTSMPRFRAPLIPFLMIYAAFGGVQIWKAIRGQELRIE